MKRKKEIDSYDNFATDFAEDWNSEYDKEIKLPNYEDEEAKRNRNLKEMEEEQKEREENGEMKTESETQFKHLKKFNEEFGKKEIIFKNKRNPRLVITVHISPDRRISEIENKTGIRFPCSIGQPINRTLEVWASKNNFLMDDKDTSPEKTVFGVRASDVPQGHEWRNIYPNKFK